MDIKNIANSINVRLSDNQVADIKVYINEIKVWNQKCNLTSLEDDEEIFVNLFLDSFTLIPHVKKGSILLDVGTGAGFPGLALKMMIKSLKITLLDSNAKKCAFLNHIINVLNLKNVNSVWGRAEEIGKKEEYREKFDIVCSRALAKMNALAELCLPFVKKGGIFLAPKGKDIGEIKASEKAVEEMGGKLQKIENIKSVYFKEGKNLIIIKKVKSTPIDYPRRTGIPQKRPL